MQIGIFVLSAIVSLTASTLLVSRLERVGERFGVSEALLGLMAALAADGPEITSAVAAIAHGKGAIGIGVTLGSNVFNLAALLGVSGLIAGRIPLHRRSILLEGTVGLWIALVGLAVVGGLVGPVIGIALALAAFVPYVAYSAVPAASRPRLSLPGNWSAWLARALAEEELELEDAIRPQRGNARDALVAGASLVAVVLASIVMEEAATGYGPQLGLLPIVIGGLILAAVTSLPNAVAAIYLASRGRGTAVLSTAFNSNAINVIIGLLVPAVILGLGGPSDEATFVALFYVGLTALAIALAIRAKGLDRRTGTFIVAGYLVFVAILVTR